MSNNESNFKLTSDVVTFEILLPTRREIPKIMAGYKGKHIVYLFQYTNDEPHPEGILPMQWFALPVSEKNVSFYRAVMAISPMGQELEELKHKIRELVNEFLT